MLALKSFQKDEHGFREQLRSNADEIFNKMLPESRETKRYLIVEGQMMAQMTGTLMQNQREDKKRKHSIFASNEVGLTTVAALQRLHHKEEHQKLTKSQQMILAL